MDITSTSTLQLCTKDTDESMSARMCVDVKSAVNCINAQFTDWQALDTFADF